MSHFCFSYQDSLSCHIRVQEEPNQNELPVQGLHTRDLNHLETGQKVSIFQPFLGESREQNHVNSADLPTSRC